MTFFFFRNVCTADPDPTLQRDLDAISSWADSNLLYLNPNKCRAIRYTWRRCSKPAYQLSINVLECVDSIKLLGCYFQSNLSWDLQVDEIISKSNRMIGLIRLVTSDASRDVALYLYKTLIVPLLDYCSPAWWVYRSKHVSKLESVQRRVTRMILRQTYQKQSYDDRRKSLELFSLDNRRQYLNMSFFAKLLVTPSMHFMSNVLDYFQVNSRHSESLTFHHVKPRVDAFKYCGLVRFPKMFSELDGDLRTTLVTEPFNIFKSCLYDHFNSD